MNCHSDCVFCGMNTRRFEDMFNSEADKTTLHSTTSYRNIWQLCFTQTWLVINIIPTCTWAVLIFYSFICRVKLIVCLKVTQNKSGSPLCEIYDCFDSFCTFCMISSWHAIRSHFQALLPIFYTQSGKLLFLFCH